MTWFLAIGAAWLALAGIVAVLLGRGIRLADRKESVATDRIDAPNFVVDATPSPAPAPVGRLAPQPRVPSDDSSSSHEHGLA